jgi:hypothetical protein
MATARCLVRDHLALASLQSAGWDVGFGARRRRIRPGGGGIRRICGCAGCGRRKATAARRVPQERKEEYEEDESESCVCSVVSHSLPRSIPCELLLTVACKIKRHAKQFLAMLCVD